VKRAGQLSAEDLSQAAIARQLSVSRAALRDWSSRGFDEVAALRAEQPGPTCDATACPALRNTNTAAYAYLLGLYLGDGCLSRSAKGVWRLRIFCCDSYPGLMHECRVAVHAVLPTSKVGSSASIGCREIHSDSKHWICAFPQHGAGRKHERRIDLAPWQNEVVSTHPCSLIRGLIHSDGVALRIASLLTTRSTPTRGTSSRTSPRTSEASSVTRVISSGSNGGRTGGTASRSRGEPRSSCSTPSSVRSADYDRGRPRTEPRIISPSRLETAQMTRRSPSFHDSSVGTTSKSARLACS
jgi:hypothetical protein